MDAMVWCVHLDGYLAIFSTGIWSLYKAPECFTWQSRRCVAGQSHRSHMCAGKQHRQRQRACFPTVPPIAVISYNYQMVAFMGL